MANGPAPKPPTLAQRSSAALQSAAEYLHLDDQKVLDAVLVEVASEYVRTSSAFANWVRQRYDVARVKPIRTRDVTATKRSPSVSGQGPKPKVTSRRTPGEHVDIVAPLDPRTLVSLYGANLQAHLDEYSVKTLSEMARMLVPTAGEKAPPQKAGQEALITYILRHVGPVARSSRT